MSLPSQAGQPRGRASRRRRGGGGVGRLIVPLVVVTVCVGAIWGALRLIESTTPANASADDSAPGPDLTQGETPGSTDAGLLSGAVQQAEHAREDDEVNEPIVESPTTSVAASDLEPREEERTSTRLETLAHTVEVEREPARVSRVRERLEEADDRLSRNDPLGARRLLLEALADPEASDLDRSLIRGRLTTLNDDLIFGPRVIEGDPMTESYRVQGGDSLSRIASRRELATNWRLIQRVNGISDPTKVRAGQTLKLVRGPFHAIVDKSDFRLDVYHGSPSDPSSWMYVRSFPVGLGADDGTPLGEFVVKRHSKVINPAWVNPRDGSERYGRDDPDNPIGEHWVGLEGVGPAAVHEGYGIHGTIEPDSIGRQESLGCVRLLDDDVAVIYEVLVEGVSRVSIVP